MLKILDDLFIHFYHICRCSRSATQLHVLNNCFNQQCATFCSYQSMHLIWTLQEYLTSECHVRCDSIPQMSKGSIVMQTKPIVKLWFWLLDVDKTIQFLGCFLKWIIESWLTPLIISIFLCWNLNNLLHFTFTSKFSTFTATQKWCIVGVEQFYVPF